MVEESRSLEHTPTWVVAVICFVIVLISLVAERGLHRLGKLLLLVGAKLEHIITRLAQEAAETKTDDQEAPPVKPSDELFWVLVQVLCSYSTLPLYTLVTQMGSMFKEGMFEDHVQDLLDNWVGDRKKRGTQHHSPQINRMVKESFEDDRIAEETSAVDEGNTASIIELSPRT
ncbi:hypothetical protein RHGRI_032071 [Rhododendron griersonianum]|uniref:Uncharacterized protein n=1 Tax=Rhododendron griersonianum TaxID=479676 RepID=A0AAV6IAF3_9ERIC|nr:hypothetical protein RHGRI_032071 [Rhododendron griersonianum]